jgi:hypothetical protein
MKNRNKDSKQMGIVSGEGRGKTYRGAEQGLKIADCEFKNDE